MNRQSAAVLILLTWVGTLGWLVWRQTGPTGGLLLDDATRTVEPGALYYAVSMGGVPVGFASTTVDTVPEGLLIEDRLSLQIPALGAIQRVEATTSARLTNTLRLQTFVAGLVGDAGRFTASGEVFGDTLLRIEFESAGSTQQIRVPLEEPVVLPVYMPLRLVFGGQPEIGNTYAIRTFDPLLLKNSDVSVRILKDSVLLVPDSAAFDSTSMSWVAARWDTVSAWQVEQKVNGLTVALPSLAEAPQKACDRCGRHRSARPHCSARRGQARPAQRKGGRGGEAARNSGGRAAPQPAD